MAQRPPEVFKQLAERIAQMVSSEDGAPVFSLMQQLGLFDSGRGEPARASPSTAAPRQVGVWREVLTEQERSFTRILGAPDSFLWAPTERIGPKRSPRVVLLGESVARGFLYDPDFSPSRCLEGLLRTVPALRELEVVDLARTDQTLGPLLMLARASLALEPDALLVFAGNNWGPFLSIERAELLEIARALRSGGVAQASEWIGQKLLSFAHTYIDGLARLSEESGVPVVIVIPQFNLGGWRNRGLIDHPPWLPGDGNARWQRAYDQARQALQRGDDETARRLATEMLELDRGLAAAGAELLAECLLRAGERREAASLLETARDADPDWTGRTTPRCPRVVQEVLRTEAPGRGLSVVDLPALFAQHLEGGLPDRRLYLDYCHLTSEGIELAMAATARQLLVLLLADQAGRAELPVRGPRPEPMVEARAHLYAAIFNCRFQQPDELITYHLKKAVASPEIAAVVLALADSLARATPNHLCSSFLEVCARLYRSEADGYGLALLTSLPFDSRLIRAMARALGEQEERRIDALLLAEHGVAADHEVDVLAYLTSVRSWFQNTAYLKAYSAESSFSLFCREPGSVELSLTFRTPYRHGDGAVTLRVNGRELEVLPLSHEGWTTRAVVVPEKLLQVGENHLCLQWPPCTVSGQEALERAARSIEAWNSWEPQEVLDLARRGSAFDLVEVVPVFGHIQRFTARVHRP